MISLIIPVFNGEKYIDSCVESIQKQSFDDFEAIFVNDGSNDTSASLLGKYASNDSRIKVIHQKNQGVAIARERGINVSEGNYIMFLDIDDTLVENALQTLHNLIGTGSDIIVGGYNIVSKMKGVTEIEYQSKQYVNELFLKNTLTSGNWTLWAKLYRKELFSEIVIPKGIKIGEDAVVLIQLILRSRSVFVSDRILYNYIQYDSSASYNTSQEYAKDGIQAALYIENLFMGLSLIDSYRKEIDAMFLLFYSNSLRRNYIQNKELLRIIKNHISLSAIRAIGWLKSVYILLNLYGGKVFYSFFHLFFSSFYKS